MKTQAEFFQAHAVDGVLSSEHMAQMLNLPEGDSGAEPQGGQPDPTPAPTPEPVATPPVETPAPTPEPVILAKDGVHTIKFEKLEEARNEAKAAKAEAEALRQQLAAAQAAPTPTPAPTAEPVKTGLQDVDFGDFSNEALSKGILEAVERGVAAALPAKVAEALAPLERRAAEDAIRSHVTTIYTAHPNLDAMLESQELEAWIVSKPSYEQAAIRAVIEQGTADQVVEVFDSFVKATGKTAEPLPTPAPVADPRAAAKAAIDKAQTAPPSSLSEIPGATGHHDEAEAMLEMTAMAQMNKFHGKSPEAILALMSKVL